MTEVKKEKIYAKVARILDEYRLVITAGEAEGVTRGMHFIVYEQGDEITDPETNESMGHIELVKAELEVIHIQEHLSLATAPAPSQTNPPKVLSAVLAEIPRSGASGLGDRPKLYVKSTDISGLPSQSPIGVGDLVRSV